MAESAHYPEFSESEEYLRDIRLENLRQFAYVVGEPHLRAATALECLSRYLQDDFGCDIREVNNLTENCLKINEQTYRGDAGELVALVRLAPLRLGCLVELAYPELQHGRFLASWYETASRTALTGTERHAGCLEWFADEWGCQISSICPVKTTRNLLLSDTLWLQDFDDDMYKLVSGQQLTAIGIARTKLEVAGRLHLVGGTEQESIWRHYRNYGRQN
ncbi:MAG: hypothetical protein EOT04_01040 [Candidatus Chaera renei]|uniref:Uncharacterized protein n=1 Tax=Candidatus Chaera renei TaxID=2506947 RepID=A0A4Q0AJ40_9BACT|nr:MAG: hypothetical protein EOT04_01040 [Candidatus Chaera renei]